MTELEISKGLLRLGENIALVRKRKRISQLRLAILAGVSKSYLCDLEHGRRNVSVSLVLKIASALEVPVEEFFQGI